MNVNDQVYSVIEGSIYDIPIPNSATILPARIESIRGNSILISITIEPGKSVLQDVSENQLYTTVQKALEAIQARITKPTEIVSNISYLKDLSDEN